VVVVLELAMAIQKHRPVGRRLAGAPIPFYAKQMTMKPRSGRFVAAFSISIACLLPLSPQTAPHTR